MKREIDTRTLKIPVHNFYRVRELYGKGWISAKARLPAHAHVLGITKRASSKIDLRLSDEPFYFKTEMVYYNDLADRWQDEANEWVEVVYWLALPEMPRCCRLKVRKLPKSVLDVIKQRRKSRSLKWVYREP